MKKKTAQLPLSEEAVRRTLCDWLEFQGFRRYTPEDPAPGRLGFYFSFDPPRARTGGLHGVLPTGWPDLLIVRTGLGSDPALFFAVEVKGTMGRWEKEQQAFAKAWLDCGEYVVAKGETAVEEVRTMLEKAGVKLLKET
jgi:hypothetical protein